MDKRQLPGLESNAMINRPTLIRCAGNAALIGAIFAVGAIVSIALRAAESRRTPRNEHFWLAAAEACAVMFAGAFSIIFVWNLVRSVRAEPLNEVLEEETPEAELLPVPLYGFVAMEFYWLIWNRTFVVFVTPEGLYGWKAAGAVTNADREYYRPLRDMLADAEFMRDLPAIRKLAGLPGGFIYPKSEIVAVTSDDRRQWGMGGIPYAGHIQLRLVSGMTRKLILLGEIIPDEVRDRVVAALGTGITSVV